MDAPAAASAPAAGAAPVNSFENLPLKDWRPEQVEEWRNLLPETFRKKFKEFFVHLPPEADGSTLASYDLPALLLVFPKLGAFAPELYTELQKCKLLANAGSGGSSDDYTKKTYELVYKLAAKDEEQQLHVSISDINAEKGAQLRETLRIALRTFVDDSYGTKREKRFAWGDATEHSHAAAYIAWLKEKDALGSLKSVKILDGNKYPQLLTTAATGSLPFRLVGTTDVVIVDFASHETDLQKVGVVIAIELKKKITTTNVDQAIAQLAAADYNSQHAPIVVLTDLNDDWRFFWFEKEGKQTIIRVTKTSQQKAFKWIRQRCNELAPRRE